MKIIRVPYILTPDRVLLDHEICFQERIIGIGKELSREYPEAEVISWEGKVLLPGFCNPHIHLEFSANRATLSYGEFLPWLESVIEYREELIPRCDEECIRRAIEEVIGSGTTTIGAISSYGHDLEPLVRSPLNVLYFSELIGSNPAAADPLFADFIERYYRAQKYESQRFRNGIGIHSPYAVHHVLAKKALEIARREGVPVTTHFMESRAEREWIDGDRGPFRSFFQKFLGQSRAVNRSREFLELFHGLRTLFVHAIWSTDEELELMAQGESQIVHCPISNRLLGNGVLDLKRLRDHGLDYMVATDGLSSNYSLNLYEDLRAALFLHPEENAVQLARDLIVRATRSASWLGFESGSLEVGYMADFQIVSLPPDLRGVEEIYLHTILHTKRPEAIYLKGVRYGERK
ncbi:MAG: metal-dependent hydrolase [Epsilonproteobacteria bacterium]|nr:chlorohydrolase [Campylobacterota bacterium]NPA56699.1 metal-dependent hydrolase [Campylobacterota bacterium]